MIDFYEELNLDENDELDDIQNELERLEVIWKRRRTSDMGLAQKKLGVIDQAQKAFESESSKEEYDKALYDFKHPKKVDSYAKRKEQFLKYKTMAKDFYDNKEYDLAEDAISKAVNLVGEDTATGDFYLFASNVLLANNNIDSAIKYINQAILMDRKNPKYYYAKAWLFAKKGETENCVELAQAAEKYAIETNRTDCLAKIYDLLAFAYYFKFSQKAEGYSYAQKALSFDDNLPNSKDIVKELEKEYVEAKNILESMASVQDTKIYRSIIELHEIKESFKKIGYYKDAKDKINECNKVQKDLLYRYNVCRKKYCKYNKKNSFTRAAIMSGIMIVLYIIAFVWHDNTFDDIADVMLCVSAVISFYCTWKLARFGGFFAADEGLFLGLFVIGIPVLANIIASSMAIFVDYRIYESDKIVLIPTLIIVHLVLCVVGTLLANIEYKKVSCFEAEIK